MVLGVVMIMVNIKIMLLLLMPNLMALLVIDVVNAVMCGLKIIKMI